MPSFLQIRIIFVTILALISLLCVSVLHAVMDPRFELDSQAISGLKSPSKPQQTGGKRTPGTSKKSPKATVSRRSEGSVTASGNAPEQSLTLESPVPALTGQEAVARTQSFWKMIVPSNNEPQKPLSFQTPIFSLTLDQERYPVFARVNGGRIILDRNGTIPPLVKSLIEDKDASVRIVSESPNGSKRFISSLLEAAGFYSVEENFSIEFGTDPKLTVRADFKVEKNADSLINQDVIIISNNRTSVPPALGNFLKKEGFSLYEPFASLQPFVPLESRSIHSVSAIKQPDIVDSILSVFSAVSYTHLTLPTIYSV